MRRHSKLAAIALVILLAACGKGLITSFRIALASSAPLVNSLVASGAIPREKAAAVIADFDAGAVCGQTLQADFAAISKDLPADQKKALKLTASTKAFRCFRVVIDRQNFALHPRLQQAANIADGILASLVLFYGGGPAAPSDAARAATVHALSEESMERQVKAQVKALEAAMKP